MFQCILKYVSNKCSAPDIFLENHHRLGMQNNLKVFENKQAEKPKQDSQNGLRLHMPEGDLNNNYII